MFIASAGLLQDGGGLQDRPGRVSGGCCCRLARPRAAGHADRLVSGGDDVVAEDVVAVVVPDVGMEGAVALPRMMLFSTTR